MGGAGGIPETLSSNDEDACTRTGTGPRDDETATTGRLFNLNELRKCMGLAGPTRAL